MATVRKRIGGGWKNVPLPAPKKLDPNLTATDNVSAKDKEIIKDTTPEDYSQNQYDKNSDNKMNRSVDSSEGENGPEYKWQKDENESEKEKKPDISPRHSSNASASETKVDRADSQLEDDTFEANETDKSNEGGSFHLPEIKHSGSVSVKSDISSSDASSLNTRISSGINYDDYPILRRVQDSVIGHDLVINAPFGPRKITYCDYTASGRCLSFVEDFIRTQVIPAYANTHSTTGHNARQTGKFREEARNIIKQCVNANKDDVVVFTGSGATAGIHKIAWALKMNIPRIAAETAVFIGPYEHHSNILLWREFGTKVVRIRHNPHSGMVDLEHLAEELKFWREKKRHLLVCMSAASNVTGIITDVDAVAGIAHQHGAVAIFDYAGGGPYLKIDMNASKLEYKDAAIISPHKFVGGPGTPGVVVAKKWMFKNLVPDRVGGGTVRYVTRELHAYVGNIEEREEGGTPAIIESIRAGIVFQLKKEISTDLIHTRERQVTRRAFAVWEENPCIFVLGSHTADRIPIFSFLTVHQETGRLIHHNFISSLLSDLYGIQARGGCACAGPYAADLMGISEHLAKKYMHFLSDKGHWKDHSGHLEVMKPGFTRINLPYFADDESIDFVIQAVDMVTKYGWKLLPQYSFDMKSGSWYHKSFANTNASELISLQQALVGTKQDSRQQPVGHSHRSPSYKEILKAAAQLYEEADNMYQKSRISSASLSLREQLPKDKRGLKWFLTPHEAVNILADTEKEYFNRRPYRLPFKLEKPSFLTEMDMDSEYHHTNGSTRSNVSLPPIAHQRGRTVSNSYASDKRYRNHSLNGKSTRSTGDIDHVVALSLEDGRPRQSQRPSYDKNVIDSYGTPMRVSKVADKRQHGDKHSMHQKVLFDGEKCDPCSIVTQ